MIHRTKKLMEIGACVRACSANDTRLRENIGTRRKWRRRIGCSLPPGLRACITRSFVLCFIDEYRSHAPVISSVPVTPDIYTNNETGRARWADRSQAARRSNKDYWQYMFLSLNKGLEGRQMQWKKKKKHYSFQEVPTSPGPTGWHRPGVTRPTAIRTQIE